VSYSTFKAYLKIVVLKISWLVKKSCPKCGSGAIDFYAGGLTGIYHCKNCGYSGAIIVEEDTPIKK